MNEPNNSARRRRPSKLEYGLYFAVIFTLSLPVALARWVFGRSRSESGARKGVVSRAWNDARSVTPLIFSA